MPFYPGQTDANQRSAHRRANPPLRSLEAWLFARARVPRILTARLYRTQTASWRISTIPTIALRYGLPSQGFQRHVRHACLAEHRHRRGPPRDHRRAPHRKRRRGLPLSNENLSGFLPSPSLSSRSDGRGFSPSQSVPDDTKSSGRRAPGLFAGHVTPRSTSRWPIPCT